MPIFYQYSVSNDTVDPFNPGSESAMCLLNQPFDANFESQPLLSLFPQFLLRDPDLRVTEGENKKVFVK